MLVGTANAISNLRYRTGCPELKTIAIDYETGLSEDDSGILEDSRIANNNFKLSNEVIPTESLSEMGEWSLCGNFNVHERAYSPYSFTTVRYVSRHEGIEDNECE